MTWIFVLVVSVVVGILVLSRSRTGVSRSRLLQEIPVVLEERLSRTVAEWIRQGDKQKSDMAAEELAKRESQWEALSDNDRRVKADEILQGLFEIAPAESWRKGLEFIDAEQKIPLARLMHLGILHKTTFPDDMYELYQEARSRAKKKNLEED